MLKRCNFAGWCSRCGSSSPSGSLSLLFLFLFLRSATRALASSSFVPFSSAAVNSFSGGRSSLIISKRSFFQVNNRRFGIFQPRPRLRLAEHLPVHGRSAVLAPSAFSFHVCLEQGFSAKAAGSLCYGVGWRLRTPVAFTHVGFVARGAVSLDGIRRRGEQQAFECLKPTSRKRSPVSSQQRLPQTI